MPAIYENLKRIRSERGLTQEAVAEKLGVTRQTVSSYESGRTRPDVETLKRFAEVYHADFYDILYGERKKNEKIGELRLLSIAALTISFLSGLIRAALRFTANTFFYVEGVTEVTDSIRAVLNKRFALLDAGSAVEAISLTLFGICCII
ncbi:MAG: helix-turn-helix domain-containing protein [Bacillota bacterium]|nr:helix-turn-helix domain-containing protein [Bacillota bacterium]